MKSLRNDLVVKTFVPALLLTAILVVGQVAGIPNEIREPVTGTYPTDVVLHYPMVYTAFAPFFHLLDHLTILGARQHIVWILWLNIAWLLWRVRPKAQLPALSRLLFRGTELLALNAAWLVLLAIVIWVPRPSAFPVTDKTDAILVDFHSHTNHSWDGRKDFTPDENLKFHLKTGFHAAYITDHNTIKGSEEAQALYRMNPQGEVPLRGEEVSLKKGHWLVLGNTDLIDPGDYPKGMEGIRVFLEQHSRSGPTLVFASLPEYWLNHWENIELFINWGLAGFEIINGAPKSLDFPSEHLDKVLALCRQYDLAVIGAADTHGYGSATVTWNLLEISGWRGMDPGELDQAIRDNIKEKGFGAVRVLERVRAVPCSNIVLLGFDPLRQLWIKARAITLPHALISLAWIWVLSLAISRSRNVLKKIGKSDMKRGKE